MKNFEEFLLEANSSNSNYVSIPGPKADYEFKFTKYVRSLPALQVELKEYNLPFSILGIARLFAEHNIALADNTILSFTTDELWKYKEYDRRPGSHQEKYRDNGEHYEKLKNKIKKNGIMGELILNIHRMPDESVQVFIGEGNHRLAIARELHIQRLQTSINYSK